MRFTGSVAKVLIRLALVLLINFSLFLIIPVSQELFAALNNKDKDEKKAQTRMVAEMVQKKKPKKSTPKKSRIRSVSSSSGKSLQSPMKFKLTPDLSVGGAGDGATIATGQMEAQVFEEGAVDQPAVAQSIPPFKYPKEARKLAVEGEGLITFVVGTNGAVAEILSIEVPHKTLEKAVRVWLPTLRFKPAMNQGVPVAQKMQLPMDFTLQ